MSAKEKAALTAKIKFKTKRQVTMPVLKIAAEVTRYVELTGKIYTGKEMPQKAGEDKPKKPARLVHCIDLESGEIGIIVLNKVLESTLQEEYPEDSYVGKQFAITKLPKVAGKDYHPFKLLEIEVEK